MKRANLFRVFARNLVAWTLLVSVGLPLAAAEPASQGVLAAKLQHFVDEHVMAGAVMAVADKDRIRDLEAVGYSDLAAKKPMQTDNLFWIASMSKPITAAAFMMLVDEGRVKLDDPVEKFLPEFKNVKVAAAYGSLVPPNHPIMIREILSHTSGMGFLNSTDKHLIDAVPLAESIQHDLLEPLLFQPGTAYSYSNEGIDTAGLIIEKLSGMPYEKFLQERLFNPLGMKDTTFNPTEAQLQRLAKSYKTNPEKTGLEETTIAQLKQPLGGPGHYPSPAGGLFSTALDCVRFCQMLANGGTFEGRRYLSQEAVKAMTTKQTPASVKEQYGLGLAVGDGFFAHGGAYKTSMEVDHGQIRVFMVQQANEWAHGNPGQEFAREARNLFPVGQ